MRGRDLVLVLVRCFPSAPPHCQLLAASVAGIGFLMSNVSHLLCGLNRKSLDEPQNRPRNEKTTKRERHPPTPPHNKPPSYRLTHASDFTAPPYTFNYISLSCDRNIYVRRSTFVGDGSRPFLAIAIVSPFSLSSPPWTESPYPYSLPPSPYPYPLRSSSSGETPPPAPSDVCAGCGVKKSEMKAGCNGQGRIAGGVGAVIDWWPIKAYRPCPAFEASGGKYTRKGQITDEVLFGRNDGSQTKF